MENSQSTENECFQEHDMSIFKFLQSLDTPMINSTLDFDFNEENGIENIEKMEATIKVKLNEIKKLKESRITLEKELITFSHDLTQSNVPNAMKRNIEKFISLIKEIYEKEADPGTNEENKDASKKKTEENPKLLNFKETNKNFNFLEKNIQLAKCGRGVLSLTDEEKLRLESLLADIEPLEASAPTVQDKIAFDSEKRILPVDIDFPFSDQCKATIRKIDKELEVFGKCLSLEEQQCEIQSESMKESNKESKIKSVKLRLKEIEECLVALNSTTNEEVSALSEEDMQVLIMEAVENLRDARLLPASQKAVSLENNSELCSVSSLNVSSLISAETVKTLVYNAKSLMPKYKYKYEQD